MCFNLSYLQTNETVYHYVQYSNIYSYYILTCTTSSYYVICSCRTDRRWPRARSSARRRRVSRRWLSVARKSFHNSVAPEQRSPDEHYWDITSLSSKDSSRASELSGLGDERRHTDEQFWEGTNEEPSPAPLVVPPGESTRSCRRLASSYAGRARA